MSLILANEQATKAYIKKIMNSYNKMKQTIKNTEYLIKYSKGNHIYTSFNLDDLKAQALKDYARVVLLLAESDKITEEMCKSGNLDKENNVIIDEFNPVFKDEQVKKDYINEMYYDFFISMKGTIEGIDELLKSSSYGIVNALYLYEQILFMHANLIKLMSEKYIESPEGINIYKHSI